jgi:hypothetical protein
MRDGAATVAHSPDPVAEPFSLALSPSRKVQHATLQFGAGAWRVRFELPLSCDPVPGPENRDGRHCHYCLPRLPERSVFRARVRRDQAGAGDGLPLLIEFDDGVWEEAALLPFAAEEGQFLVTRPALLLSTTEVPAALMAAFPALILIAGQKGGVGGPKPAKKVGGGDPAPPETETPSTTAKVTAHIFRADDNGAFWKEMFAGNIDWEAEEARAEKEGWEDSDENPFAEKSEILDHLSKMDGDDIWVYSGHLGFRNEDNVAQADNKPNYLVGWDSEEYKFISKAELRSAMAGSPPGLVVISGCQSWDMREVFSGAKIFAGFTTVVDDKESDATAKVFLQALWEGNSIAAAEGTADNFFRGRFVNKKNGGRFRVLCADKTKTIYETLGVPRKTD